MPPFRGSRRSILGMGWAERAGSRGSNPSLTWIGERYAIGDQDFENWSEATGAARPSPSANAFALLMLGGFYVERDAWKADVTIPVEQPARRNLRPQCESVVPDAYRFARQCRSADACLADPPPRRHRCDARGDSADDRVP